VTAAAPVLGRIPWSLAVAGSVAVVATVFLARGLLVGPTLDGAVFALIGDAVAGGKVPYRDLWDHKPPGIYALNALAGVLLPFLGVWARAWLMTWLSTVGAIAGLTVLLGRSDATRSGIVLSLLLALPMVAAYHFALGGGQTESAGLAFAGAGVGMAVGDGRRWRVGAGVALAIAMAISPQFIPAGAAAVVVLARGRSRWRGFAEFGLGAVAVAFAFVAWLAIAGALPDALDTLVDYNRLYLAVNQQLRAQGLLTASLDGLFVLPLIVVAMVRVASFRRRGATELEVAATVWVAVWVVLLGVQGVFFDHYAITLAPALVILAAPALGSLLGSIGRLRRAQLLRPLVLTALLVPPIVGIGLTEGSAHAADSLDAASAEIQRLTSPGDPIFVWGNETQVYYESDRPPASRFVYMFPLTLRGYATPERIGAIIGGWLVRPPRLIIDTTVNPGRVGGYPLTGASGEADRPDATLDPLRDFILSRYTLKESVGTWDFYTLKNLAGG
jgi:hypothetical protein